jgi:hypothetical protein
MTRDKLNDLYFDWMLAQVKQDYSERDKPNSFHRLLVHLHQTIFRWSIPKDKNRAEDGLSLRRRFALDQGLDGQERDIVGPCSVLEMMISLAFKCEEEFMDDPLYGNRTSQWFWNMIVSLGLGSMTDRNFEYQYVVNAIQRFLDRDYEPNGKGGLFTIRHCDRDLRDVEIWHQLCWYVDSIIY